MKHSGSEVSIDQLARLAGQAGCYVNHVTCEIDRSALLLVSADLPDQSHSSIVGRIIQMLSAYLRR